MIPLHGWRTAGFAPAIGQTVSSTLTVSLIVLGGLTLGGCSAKGVTVAMPTTGTSTITSTGLGSDPAASPSATDLPSSPSGSTSAPRPGGTTATSTSPRAGARPCTNTQIKVSAGAVDSGAGQRYVPLTFTNISTAACQLRGYPGVDGLDAAGHRLTSARRQSGTPVTIVTLAPLKHATATVHAGAIPSGSATACAADYAGLLVTAPNLTVSVRFNIALPSCAGLTITPVVA